MKIKKTRNLPSKRDEFPYIQVPKCCGVIQSSDRLWTANIWSFPDVYQLCNALKSQHIPPFPEATRELLIQNYCTAKNRYPANENKNKHGCLVRPYLARRRIRKEPSKIISPRNYPLHVDQMENLGLLSRDISFYAQALAKALATLHWIRKVDGNGVECVLAPQNGQ